MAMKFTGGSGEKFFWSWSEANKARQENRWFEVNVSGGELELHAGRLHLIAPWPQF